VRAEHPVISLILSLLLSEAKQRLNQVPMLF